MSSTLDIRYFISSHQGLVRDNNEDYYGDVSTPLGHVYVVCDGMGGHNAGEEASRIAVTEILRFLQESADPDIPAVLSQAIQSANTAIFEASEANPELHGMGTTCVVLYQLSQGSVYLGHVGDSRIYLFRDGVLSRLTRDHSYVQYLVSTGEITEAEAETHPSKNQILKALGIDDTVSPEVSEQPFQPLAQDVMLLCSDGLSDMVTDDAIRQVLGSYSDYNQETVEHLLSEALNAGGKDNVTVGLLHIIHLPNEPITVSPPADVSNIRDVSADNHAPDSTTLPGNKTATKWVIILILLLSVAAAVYWFVVRDNKKSGKGSPESSTLTARDSLRLPVAAADMIAWKAGNEDALTLMTPHAIFLIGTQPLRLLDSIPTSERPIDVVVTEEDVYYSLDNNRIYRQSLLQDDREGRPTAHHITEKITRLYPMSEGHVLATHNDQQAVLMTANPADSDIVAAPDIDYILVHPSRRYFLTTSDASPGSLLLHQVEPEVAAEKLIVPWEKSSPIVAVHFTDADSPRDFLAVLQDGRAYLQIRGLIVDSVMGVDPSYPVISYGLHKCIMGIGDSIEVYQIKENRLNRVMALPAAGREVIASVGEAGSLYVADQKSCRISWYKEGRAAPKEFTLPAGLCGGNLFAVGHDLFVATDFTVYQLSKP